MVRTVDADTNSRRFVQSNRMNEQTRYSSYKLSRSRRAIIDVTAENLPIRYDATTLVFPQSDRRLHVADDLSNRVDHSLPDSTQITKIEDVVELGRRWQHLDLRRRTQPSASRR
jgi:hypothetical protein